jgi:hypothetical protein
LERTCAYAGFEKAAFNNGTAPMKQVVGGPIADATVADERQSLLIDAGVVVESDLFI